MTCRNCEKPVAATRHHFFPAASARINEPPTESDLFTFEFPMRVTERRAVQSSVGRAMLYVSSTRRHRAGTKSAARPARMNEIRSRTLAGYPIEERIGTDSSARRTIRSTGAKTRRYIVICSKGAVASQLSFRGRAAMARCSHDREANAGTSYTGRDIFGRFVLCDLFAPSNYGV